MALRVLVIGPQLRVMIEMPTCELTRRDAARDGIKEAEYAFGPGTGSLENGVMDDLVQQNREVEDGEPLNDRERDPDERTIEMDQSPGAKRDDRKLPRGHGTVPPAGLLMQIAQQGAGESFAQLSFQRCSVPRIVM